MSRPILRTLQEDNILNFAFFEAIRKDIIWKIQSDLAEAGLDLGQTQNQVNNKIDQLFSTFGGDWAVYALTGATAIVDSIQNDTTIAWLDTVYPPGSGVTFRDRIINRLT